MASISQFKSNLAGGGARANHFLVSIPIKWADSKINSKLTFLCNSASLPASSITEIPVMFQGRSVHVAGERVFGDWSINVYNDTDFDIRDAFEYWSERMLNAQNTSGVMAPKDYVSDLFVDQLDRNGKPIKTYAFVNAFPTNIGDIALSYNAGGEIESFPVTFSYDYWVTEDSTPEDIL
jgi:hypothetical protein